MPVWYDAVMWVVMTAAEREEFLAGVHVGVLGAAVGTAGPPGRSGGSCHGAGQASRAVLGAYLFLPPVWWALMIGSGSMLSMMARMSSGLSHSQSCSR